MNVNYIIPLTVLIIFILFNRKRIVVNIKGLPIKFYWVYAWYDLWAVFYWSRKQHSLYFVILGVGCKIHFHEFDIDDLGKEIKCKHCKQEESWYQMLRRIKN